MTISLAVLVGLPVAMILIFGIRLSRREQEAEVQQTRDLLRVQLQDQDRLLARLIGERERLAVDLLADVDGLAEVDALWDHPLLDAAFVIDAAGKMQLPDPVAKSPSRREKRFLERTRDVLAGGDLAINGSDEEEAQSPGAGWVTWFWHDGLRLVYRMRLTSGAVGGVEFNRVRFLADVVAALPDSAASGVYGPARRIALLDSRGQVVYQWGRYRPRDSDLPAVVLKAAPPLDSWQWIMHVPAEARPRRQGALRCLVVLGISLSVGAVLLALAWIVHREIGRRVREAATRVSFVNRVSHELRSPLTNICMYAELLENRMSAHDDACRQYCDIIARESRRLGRLISNVLTFARQRRRALEVCPRPVVPDDIIRRVVEECRPTLENADLTPVMKLTVAQTVDVDPDAFEQILFNLLSNAAKYASGGEHVVLTSERTADRYVVRIADDGPGIPPHLRERIFDPFYRSSNAVSDGVSGTGIGLAIARQLAELHGGSLEAVQVSQGACFECRLPVHRQPKQRVDAQRHAAR